WYTVRANGAGWTARKKHADVVVAMNVESVDDDIAHMRAGDMLILNKSLASHLKRDDLEVHVVPFDELVVPVCPDTRLRKMVVNMLYVGVLAHLLRIEMDEVKKAVARQFGKKVKAAELNTAAAVHAYEWATKNLPAHARHTLKRID